MTFFKVILATAVLAADDGDFIKPSGNCYSTTTTTTTTTAAGNGGKSIEDAATTTTAAATTTTTAATELLLCEAPCIKFHWKPNETAEKPEGITIDDEGDVCVKGCPDIPVRHCPKDLGCEVSE